jgi:HSP20 family protein
MEVVKRKKEQKSIMKGGETMKIRKWEPEREIELIKREIDRVFEDFFSPALSFGATTFPKLDVIEDKEAFIVKVDVPGFSKEDLKINLEENLLTITGKRDYEKELKGKNALRTERYYGEFSRTITIPSTVNAFEIKAEYKAGVLTLYLPKKESAKPKVIDIKVEE